MTTRKKLLIGGLSVSGLFLALLIGAFIVVQTAWFRSYMKQKIISSTEEATGGKVEIGSFSFDVFHLRAVAIDFVIHGTEAASAAPLLKASRVEVDLRLFTSLSHVTDVTYLGIEKPQANVFVLADGSTNIPTPKQTAPSTTTALEEVVDLAIGHFQLSDGLLVFNEQKQPINLRANNLRAELWFNLVSQTYSGQLGMEPIYVVSGRNTPVRFRLTLPVTLERDRIILKNAALASDASTVAINAIIENLHNPKLTAHLNGKIGLADIKNIGNVSLTLNARNVPDSVNLDANAEASSEMIQVTGLRLSIGRSTLEASGTLKNLNGTGELQFKSELALDELGRLANVGARPDGTLDVNGKANFVSADRYDVSGNLQASRVAFMQGRQKVSGIDFNSALHVDPRQIELQSLRLDALGGEFRGDASLEDFARYKLAGSLAHLDLQTAARAFGESLPYDGVISGPIAAQGDLNSTGTRGIIAQTQLAISPGRRGIPMSGQLDAHYNGTANSVVIANSFIALPHSRLTIDGLLNERLNINVTSRDLNDLTAAASPPQKSPVLFVNGGQATFAGTVAGDLSNPNLSGHLDVSKFAVDGRQFQDLAADVSASSSQAGLRNGTLQRTSQASTTTAEFSASAGLRNWKPLPREPVSADINVHSSDLGDLVALAGMQPDGYSGSLSAIVHVEGTEGNPRGVVNVQANSGTLDGNAFDKASMQVNLQDRLVTIPAAYITSGASRVDLTGEFQHPQDSFATGRVHAHLQSNRVDLAQIRYVRNAQLGSGGVVQMNLDAVGSLTETKQQTAFVLSAINGDLSAKDIKLNGQTYGDLTANARTSGNTVTYGLTSDFAGSNVKVNGSTQFATGYPTSADADISHLPIERVLRVAKQSAVPARGMLSGTAHLSGTIQNPTGNANFDLANAVVYDEPLDHIRATATYLANSIEVSRLEVLQGQQRLDLSGRFDHPSNDLQSGNLQFKIDSTRIDLAKLRNIQKLCPGLGGDLQIAANGAATVRAGSPTPLLTSLDANVGATGLAFRNEQLGDVTLKAGTAAGNRVTFGLASNLAGSTIQGQGNAQLTGDYPVDARLDFNNVNWAGLAPLLGSATEPPTFDAATDGQLTISGPAMKTDQLRGSLQLSRLSMDSRPRPGLPRTVSVRNQGTIQLALDHGTVTISNAHLTGSQTDIEATGTASITQQTSNLNVKANVNLALLQNLDQDFVSSGGITANASIKGSFNNPQIVGQVQLQKASVNYTGFPNGISNANGTIALNGNNATIRTLEGESGGGKLSASGFVSFAEQLSFGLRARATSVRTRIQQGVSVVSDADVRLTGGLEASTLSGTVTVNQLTYAPQTDIGALLSRSNTPVEAEETSAPLLDNMKLDIRVRNAPSLGVQASVAQNLQAIADLRVRGTASQPAVLGRITVTEGQLVFFGSTYTVNSGSISFFNPLRIEPILNVNLETRAQGVDVVLTVTGPIDNMKLSYTSDPPLQFQEIVGLLAAGTTPTSDPTLLANQPSQPAQSFTQMGESAIVGKALADPVTNRLQRVFGITQLKVDPAFTTGSQLPTARVTFQQQISTNVTFTYTTALDDPNSTIVRAEWAFNPQYSAVATRDQNGLISVLLFYKRQLR